MHFITESVVSQTILTKRKTQEVSSIQYNVSSMSIGHENLLVYENYFYMNVYFSIDESDDDGDDLNDEDQEPSAKEQPTEEPPDKKPKK